MPATKGRPHGPTKHRLDHVGREGSPAHHCPVQGAGRQHPEVDADERLTALADRVADKSAKYLRALIELNAKNDRVSLADLATHLGVEKREVDGWNRNLGRSVKAVVRDHGFLRPEHEDGTAQVFDFHWDNDANLWRYTVPEKFRSILTKALDER